MSFMILIVSCDSNSALGIFFFLLPESVSTTSSNSIFKIQDSSDNTLNSDKTFNWVVIIMATIGHYQS